MFKNKKSLLIFVLLATATALFAGGQQESGASVEDELITISVWNRNGTLMGEAVDRFNAKMEKEGRNLRAEFTLVPYEEQSSKFISSLSASKAPDVYAIDLILAPFFSNNGAWTDISDKVEQLSYKKDLNPGMFRLGEWDGKQYCVPWANDNSSLIYNKEIFRQAGISPPTTWKETLEAAEKIKNSTDAYGITFCGGNQGMTMFTWLPFVWMNGGRLISDNGKVAQINSPEAVQALQFWTDLVKYAPQGAPTYDYGDYYNGFTTGQVGMIFGGSWHVMAISNDAPDIDFGIVPFPVPEKEMETSAFMGGDIVGIPSTSKYPDEAWEFIEFCLSEEVQTEVLAKNGSVPVRLSVAMENKYFDEDPRYKVFAAGGLSGRAPKAINYNDMTTVMGTVMSIALSGDMSPENALNDANPRIQELIK